MKRSEFIKLPFILQYDFNKNKADLMKPALRRYSK